MLSRISITNYAIIEQAHVEFQQPFSVFSGETGAGKSIIMNALSLALGKRADATALKNSEKKCIIEATFKLPIRLKPFFDAEDLDFEEVTFLRREITPSGRSRSFVNDTPVNQQTLQALAPLILDIHSQHQNLQLFDDGFRQELIDGFAGVVDIREEYRSNYKERASLIRQIDLLETKNSDGLKEQDFLQFQLEEINAFNPVDKDEELEAAFKRMAGSEELKRAFEDAEDMISGGQGSIIDKLISLEHRLEGVKEYEDTAGDLASRIQSMRIELEDIYNEVQRLNAGTEFGEEEYREAEERMNMLNTLLKKHMVSTVAELQGIQQEIEEKLNGFQHLDEEISEKRKTLVALENKMDLLAGKLTRKRVACLNELTTAVKRIVAELGMKDAELIVEHASMTDFGPDGKDSFAWLFSANKGHAPAPLNKVASGGELSRLVLALKYLLAKTYKLPAIVFDEIDMGVSGEVADKVGAIMKDLSASTQVIAITHSPQVAARADQHFLVQKSDAGDKTVSNIKLLNTDERLEELAKMLSGSKLTNEARENARILLLAN